MAVRSTDRWPVLLAASQVVGAIAVVLAVEVFPWALYRRSDSTAHSLSAGSFGVGLVVLAVAAVVVAAASLLTSRRALLVFNCGLGAAAAILTVLTAAHRIAHANSLTMSSGGSTGFGFGVGLALGGAVAIIAAAVSCLDRLGAPAAERPLRV